MPVPVVSLLIQAQEIFGDLIYEKNQKIENLHGEIFKNIFFIPWLLYPKTWLQKESHCLKQ